MVTFMVEVTKLRDNTQEAKEAERLLNDKQFKKAMSAIEQQYIDALLTASEKDDLGRFRYAEAIKVVRMVDRHLRIAINAGKLSQADLDAMKGKKASFF